MKTFTTLICSIALFVLGSSVIYSAMHKSEHESGYQTMAAATLDLSKMQIPRDLLLDASRNTNVQELTPVVEVQFDSMRVDSLNRRVKELESKSSVIKTKWLKAPAPKPIVKTIHDTIFKEVPVYYLATQVGNKEGPTEKCVSVYEVHKVDEICPEKPIPSPDIGE